MNPFHVILCVSKDIKGLLAANIANIFFKPRNIKLTVLLDAGSSVSDGAKLAGIKFTHEYSDWFGTNAYIEKLDEENVMNQRNIDGSNNETFSTFKELESSGLEIVTLENKINSKANQEMLRRMEPDVVFSARFLHIFKEETIKIPKYGVWNIHPGDLPKYKGLHCDMRAMIAGEKNVCMSLHYIDTGIDTGEMINKAYVPIDINESLFMHRILLHIEGMNMFFKEVLKIVSPDDAFINEIAIDSSHNTSIEQYFTWPSEEEYEKFDNMNLIHCKQSDKDFIKGLFDKRLAYPTSIKQLSSGRFTIV